MAIINIRKVLEAIRKYRQLNEDEKAEFWDITQYRCDPYEREEA
ncbi:MAG: hypothetical protein PHV99_03740 [Candidatus Pacebacteria bacterium]|nr:hypothetical protein [Candidatus Paceibacterota bacterium]